jgi:methylmalonyl-CoA carboxyltransferase small subunit
MKLKLTIDGKAYEVEVEIEEDQPVRNYAPAAVMSSSVVPLAPPPVPGAGNGGGSTAADDKVCRSPMVGIIVRVNTQEGQNVQKDDPLLVLEAMKMETTITSPQTAKVKAILVAAGESVQAGQVLVEFE